MNNYKAILKSTVIFFLSCILIACATTQTIGGGTIVAEKRILTGDYKPHEATASAASVGAFTGATLGAVFGIVATLGEGASLGEFLGVVAVSTVVMGVIYGAIGSIVAYPVDVYNHSTDLYQFTVKPDDGSQNMTVTQYTNRPLPTDTKVTLFKKDNAIHFKPVGF